MSGGKPRSVAVDQLVDVTDRRSPPFEDHMLQSRGSGRSPPTERASGTDRSLKNSVGAIGWPGDGPLFTEVELGPGRAGVRHRARSSPAPARMHNYFCPLVPRGSGLGRPLRRASPRCHHGSYLVDSASSHMLVSKIKPCMSKYKQSYCETANGSLNQLSFI
jgi:hypothetical protein